MNSTPPPDAAALATALRARADGFHQAEAAAVELLVCNASWLHREDFRDGYVHVGTSGIMAMAAIDWPTAIAALDNGDLPCSGGERRILRLAASLADGIPVDLRDLLTGWTLPTSTGQSRRCCTPQAGQPCWSALAAGSGVPV